MNPTIIKSTIEQRLKSPVRMAIGGALLFLPLLGMWFLPVTGFMGLDNGFKFGLVIGAGIIGQDLSAGVLQLMFARPVTRMSYVVNRWLGCVALAVAMTAFQVLSGWLILQTRGMPMEAGGALAYGATQVLAAIGIVSVLTLFSALIGGFGDLGLYLLATIFGGVMGAGGQITGTTWARRTGEEIGRFLSPGLNIERLIATDPVSWFQIVSFVSTIVICITAAVWRMNRRELSYASSS
jgi:ABC-type transport system involved in multi-copper enzyme maturation permease subunit